MNTGLPSAPSAAPAPSAPASRALRHQPAHRANSTIVLPPFSRDKEQEHKQGLHRCRLSSPEALRASAVRPCSRPRAGQAGCRGPGHTTSARRSCGERGRVRPHTHRPHRGPRPRNSPAAPGGPQTPGSLRGAAVPRPANPSRGNRRQRHPLPARGDSGGPADTERRREGAPYPPICPA